MPLLGACETRRAAALPSAAVAMAKKTAGVRVVAGSDVPFRGIAGEECGSGAASGGSGGEKSATRGARGGDAGPRDGARSSRPWAAPTGKTGPGGSPPPLPDRAEGTIDPDQVGVRGASRQYAGTNQGCCMSIETTRPAPAGAPGALPRAETAATYN